MWPIRQVCTLTPTLTQNMASLSLPKLRDAVVGAFVADVATMPLHWIYDDAKIKELVGGESDPEFFSPPSCPFYNNSDFPGHYLTGQPSPYGEHGRFMVDYLAQKGSLDADSYASDLRDWLRAYTGRVDHASKLFIENYDKGLRYPDVGADDNQANSFPRIAAVTALYGGTSELASKTEIFARTHQKDNLLVDITHTLTHILEKVASGASIRDAIGSAKTVAAPAVATAIERAEGGTEQSTRAFLVEYGKEIKPEFPAMGTSCANPGAFMGVIHVLLTANSYEEGVRQNILAGGDNASRAHMIGAVLGAVHGVPSEWLARTQDIEAIQKGADAILSKRQF
eukprot:comp21908_c0_seq1/m.31454 comp21908_c0_seq1/g.31454  ORF comp21908_c0_seq1/g.31454 comp21908_c0_seq1/m.31454 type:complete len:340 (-) comp21908_c0_seq1:351-1370(-)